MKNSPSNFYLKQEFNQRIYEGSLIIFFAIIVGLFQITKIDGYLLSLGRSVANPLLSANISIASRLNSLMLGFRQQHLLARRIQDLELKLASTYAQMGDFELLEQENQELRELLNSTDRTLNRVFLTQPILSFAQPAVDIPRDADLIEGSAVLIEGTLIGTVAEAKQNVAFINLLWQKDSTPVLAVTSDGIQGMAIGDGRRVLFTEVPIDAELEIGQRVVTAGQSGIEAGLFIGEIRSLASGNSAAVKTAVLEQYVSFYQSRLVEIRL